MKRESIGDRPGLITPADKVVSEPRSPFVSIRKSTIRKVGTMKRGRAKAVPAIYPEAPAIKLAEPQKIVAVDIKTRTITFAGSPPPQLVEAAKKEGRRLNLQQRLTGYAVSCLSRLMPHFGERPEYISAAKWKDVEERVRLLRSLPEHAPAESRDDLRALQTLNRLAAELAEVGDYPDGVERAICWAIDLGQLLQRGQTQIDHGEAVDVGRRNKDGRKVAYKVKATRVKSRRELSRDEFLRRWTESPDPQKTKIVTAMAREMDDSTPPKRKYYSYSKLMTFSKDWTSSIPSK